MPLINVTTDSAAGVADYTLSAIPIDGLVLVDRLPQIASDYTLAGTALHMISVPPIHSRIDVFSNLFASSTTAATIGVALDYSVTNLLQSIRDVSNVGASAQDWPDARLLRLLNRAVLEYLVPFIWKHRQGHWDTYGDTALAAGTAAYPLPSKATASTLRAVQLVDTSGNPYGPLYEEDLGVLIGLSQQAINVPTGTPTRYAFRGNSLVLFPTPADASLSLRVYYEARPSALVLNTSCVQIASFPVGAATGFFRVGYTGSAPSGFASGVSSDSVQNGPGFDVLLTGLINAHSVGSYLEVTGVKPTALAVGDWLCLAGTAPVVTGAVPELAIGCLVDYVALKAFASKMDPESFSRLKSLLGEDERRAEDFFKRRNRGDHPVVGRSSLHKFRRGAAGFVP